MNKKGQLGISIIVAIMIFMTGIILINILKPEITTARSSNALDCSNSSITDSTKLTCLVFDLGIPYFIVIVLSATGGMVVSKFTK